MSWSSGVQVDGSGEEFVADATGTVARITDAEVRADEAERIREDGEQVANDEARRPG